MRALIVAIAALVLAGCASAAGRIGPEALGLSSRDAYLEARSVARSWSADARLRWVEGRDLASNGLALPDEGVWRFHYTAPEHTRGLVVTVTPLTVDSEEQPAASPPGLIIGDAALGTEWIDGSAAVDAVLALGEEPRAPLSLLLVPTRPARWTVRGADGRWWVDAVTGEVVRS